MFTLTINPKPSCVSSRWKLKHFQILQNLLRQNRLSRLSKGYRRIQVVSFLLEKTLSPPSVNFSIFSLFYSIDYFQFLSPAIPNHIKANFHLLKLNYTFFLPINVMPTYSKILEFLKNVFEKKTKLPEIPLSRKKLFVPSIYTKL